MFDLEKFKQQYKPDLSEVVVEGKKFRFYVPSDLEPLLDEGTSTSNFPLWARIWEPSIVLAQHLATLPPEHSGNCLEIGAGLGVAGIIAARFGHSVTITEYDDIAMQFAKANAILNECPETAVKRLDWHDPQLDTKYRTIFGSEIVYRKEDYGALLKLFHAYLEPGGLIVLAEGLRRTSMEFLGLLSEQYQVKARKKVLRRPGEEIPMLLCEVRPK